MAGATRDIRIHFSADYSTLWHCDAETTMDAWDRMTMPVTSVWGHVTCGNCLRQHAEGGTPVSLILKILASLDARR